MSGVGEKVHKYNKSHAAKLRRVGGSRVGKAIATTAPSAERRKAMLKEHEQLKSTTQANRQRRVKRAVKVGAALTATALAAYGAYKFHDYIRNTNNIARAREGKELCKKYSDRAIQDFLSAHDDGKNFSEQDLYMLRMQRQAAAERITESARKQAANDSFARAVKNVYKFNRTGSL